MSKDWSRRDLFRLAAGGVLGLAGGSCLLEGQQPQENQYCLEAELLFERSLLPGG